MMTPILAQTEWLRDSPNTLLWIACFVLPLMAALATHINDDEQRHKCIAFSLSLLLISISALLLMEITDTSLHELTERRDLPGFRRRNSTLTLVIALWLTLGYVLSRFLLRLFYRGLDRKSEQEEDNTNE